MFVFVEGSGVVAAGCVGQKFRMAGKLHVYCFEQLMTLVTGLGRGDRGGVRSTTLKMEV